LGFNEAESRNHAELAWRGLKILQRKLAHSPALLTPRWAQAPVARPLVPAVLVGAWDESVEGDREVLSGLSAQPCDDVRRTFVQIADQPDAPVRRVGSQWFTAARVDSWNLLARFIKDEHIEPFHDACVTTLSERDPKFELPADQRFAAAVYGKIPAHSRVLRKGLAETLGLMAAHSEVVASMSGEQCANWIVRDVLSEPDWLLWASLADELALMAEASPDEFMNVLDREVRDNRTVFADLLKQQEGFAATAPGIGVVWALETLAWSPTHVQRATLLLAALQEAMEGR